jgi:hypothetical protein
VILMAFLLKVMQRVEVAVDLTADGVTLSDAFPMTIVLLLANIAMFVGVIGWVRNQFREMRLAEQEVLEELAAAGASAGH